MITRALPSRSLVSWPFPLDEDSILARINLPLAGLAREPVRARGRASGSATGRKAQRRYEAVLRDCLQFYYRDRPCDVGLLLGARLRFAHPDYRRLALEGLTAPVLAAGEGILYRDLAQVA